MKLNDLYRKISLHKKRKARVRGKISGCATKPRITIFRSNKFFYAQAIDDLSGSTLVSIDGAKEKVVANKDGVKKLAAEFAKRLKDAKIEEITFDRNGYLYHGVVAAFADGLRENGIKF